MIRAIRRFLLQTRVRRLQAEIAHLERVRAALGPSLDRALRECSSARLALVHMDINRPAPRVAMSDGPRDGKVRSITEGAR